MTRERALELARTTLEPHDLERNIAGDVGRSVSETILAAVAEERESCAKIADAYASEMGGFTEEQFSGEEIARRIRRPPSPNPSPQA